MTERQESFIYFMVGVTVMSLFLAWLLIRYEYKIFTSCENKIYSPVIESNWSGGDTK